MLGREFRLWKSLDGIWDLDFSRGGILSSSGLRQFFALVIYNVGRSEYKLDTFDHLYISLKLPNINCMHAFKKLIISLRIAEINCTCASRL